MKLSLNTIVSLTFMVMFVNPVWAGGPRYISLSNTISRWNTLTIHPESGSCGPLSNEETIDLLNSALLAWQDLPDVDFEYQIVEGELPDVDGTNYEDYVITGTSAEIDFTNATDDIIPIIFDDDGSIVEDLMGQDAQYSYLGLTSLNNFADEELTVLSDGQMLLNCRCLPDHPSQDTCLIQDFDATVTLDQFRSVLVHELGHLLNLDHSLANEEHFDDTTEANVDLVATMYPYVYESSTPFELSEDDNIALATIYPSADFVNEHCLVTGTLLDNQGGELRCANIVAKSSDDADTLTFVTGSLVSNFVLADDGIITTTEDCLDHCGDFQFYLKPGKNYTLSITEIDPDFVGASSVGPCVSAQESILAQSALATITSQSCTQGEDIVLGEVMTESEPNSFAEPEPTSDTPSDTTNNQAQSDLPNSCSLQIAENPSFNNRSGSSIGSAFLFCLFLLRFKKRFVTL